MAWEKSWGAQRKKLQAISEAGITPRALLEEPAVEGLAAEICWSYNILAKRRTSGVAPNPIQLSEIRAFIDLYGMPSCGIEVFEALIWAMDVKELESYGNKSSS